MNPVFLLGENLMRLPQSHRQFLNANIRQTVRELNPKLRERPVRVTVRLHGIEGGSEAGC
jgi:hypothetical protein